MSHVNLGICIFLDLNFIFWILQIMSLQRFLKSSFEQCQRHSYIVNNYYFTTRRPICLTFQRNLHLFPTLYAGHSKWQNIKHIKASKDQQKSQLFNRLLLKIKTAVQKQGGADPHINREFGDVIEMCRKANMPNTTIDKAVKRALERKSILVKLEIIGPENSLLIIDADVDNRNFFRNQVRSVLKKYVGFGFANEGRALSCFEEKGVVRVKNINGDSDFDMNQAEEIAIEADAEEVRVDDEDSTVLLFIGDELSHTKVKSYIENNYADKFVVAENSVELVPFTKTELSEEKFEQVINAIDELNELEGVSRIYNNIK